MYEHVHVWNYYVSACTLCLIIELFVFSEYGEHWHKSGIFEKRQNAYDDFIAAGEHLVKEKYTCSDKLVKMFL